MRGSTPCIIDGITSEQDISALFASKCEDLYNSVSFNVCDIKLMEDNLADKISSSPSPDVFVKPREVWDAMHKLKRGKNDGCDSLSSEHFIFAGFELSVHISMLLTALFSHGYVPDELCLSTVIPIPKDKRGDMSDSSNYRGIALSSIICKIIDLIILSRYNDLLMSSELQFGFKPKRSSGMCTMLLKEVESYYTSHASSVYFTFLDANKAFGRVNYTKLFTSLFDRQLPPTLIRFLLHMYTGHKTRVSWNKVYSDLFAISNGVRQGGILSPILFCVYINDLLVRLQKSNKGCFVGSMFVGVLAYADDIVILAPTPSSMRSLLKICDSFASEFDVKFNSIKSKCLLFSDMRARGYVSVPDFFIGGSRIEFVKSWSHLGHTLSTDLDDSNDIVKRRSALVSQVNDVLCYFGNLGVLTKLNLLFAYCSSLYGSELWDLQNTNIESLCISWCKALRRVWQLPNQTHCDLLYRICNCWPLEDEMYRRCFLLYLRCLNSDCLVVRYIAKFAIVYEQMRSPMGRNVINGCLKYNLPVLGFISCASAQLFTGQRFRKLCTADQSPWKTLILLEALFIRDGSFSCVGEDSSPFDINDIVSFLCVS
jgi:hypothetical protein